MYESDGFGYGYGYGFGMGAFGFFPAGVLLDEKMDQEFLKLPEDAQQSILRQGAASADELRREMDELREKE